VRRGVWVTIVGLLLVVGVHGGTWRLYHLLRALGL
jgi:hypothetical protein